MLQNKDVKKQILNDQLTNYNKFFKNDERLPVISEVYEDDINVNRMTSTCLNEENLFNYSMQNQNIVLLNANFQKKNLSDYLSQNSDHGKKI